MEGIQFVTDDSGRKTAVLIDLKKYGELWEDFYDSLVAKQRAEEPRETFESVRERLEKQGKLDG
jgi:hypothetical protein